MRQKLPLNFSLLLHRKNSSLFLLDIDQTIQVNTMKKNLSGIFLLILFFATAVLQAQSDPVQVEGYAYETDNRGYLPQVQIYFLRAASRDTVFKVFTDSTGYFSVHLPKGDYIARAEKWVFQVLEKPFSVGEEKVFLKLEMQRLPGYWFEMTLSSEYDSTHTAEAISGALIEVYNNTKQEEVLVLENHPYPTFNMALQPGNHYTIMIRKKGYFAKRIEAYVNVEGCILCVDGVSDLGPGVSDNLTSGLTEGTLLGNIILKPATLNKTLRIENIYYDYNKWAIRPDAARELDKVITLLRDNPDLIVELGSHTDSRGKDAYNLQLSQKRARAAVDYILEKGGIASDRIVAKGYGETQLVNHCANGVPCTEEEHQQNRRTELKIIGFTDALGQDYKPLSEILREERMEAELQKIMQEGGVIEIKAGEELPEEIRRDLEKAKKKEKKDK